MITVIVPFGPLEYMYTYNIQIWHLYVINFACENKISNFSLVLH